MIFLSLPGLTVCIVHDLQLELILLPDSDIMGI